MNSETKSFKEILGTRISSERVGRGLGVRELALIAGIEHHQLINIEKGRVDIRLSTLLKIAKALNVKARDLLDF